MKKYLLPQGNYFKANLHCHSNISDGKLSPEEIKEAYMAHGYSVVAFTDHDIMIPHPELADENFVPLTGFEVEINERGKAWELTKTCHICFIALDPQTVAQPGFDEKSLFGNAPNYKHLVKVDESVPPFIKQYTHENINEIMQICRDKGFFVTYNHPKWSLDRKSVV